MRALTIPEPRIDDEFLNQVALSARVAPQVVRRLDQLPLASQRQLLGRDSVAAREAAREMMRTYFGCDEPEETTL